MVGVTAAHFCYPISPGGLLQATAFFAQAASEAGVHAVVNMSQISARREAGSNAARQHWIAERLLDRTALVTTHLRPTFFLEWINWTLVRRGNEGILRLPFGDGRHAPVRRGPRPGQGDRCHPAESGFPRSPDLPPLRC
jgi:uncharacterized protein YbjT (DUF2867 family)